MAHHITLTSIFLITLQLTTSSKLNARPVHEVHEYINEQARIDDKIRISSSPGSLPYGNPLAGNSKQNARLHAHNQQAMFNAERIRQHKAQLQRWTKAPRLEDSYMKAYHESQENHQLALEQQQATIRESLIVTTPKIHTRQATKRRPVLSAEPTKITKADAVIRPQRIRSHRSYGSVEYQQHLQPKKQETVYLSPGPTYDQGVTIKPNGNVGITHLQMKERPNKLYTEAVPSSKYVYPKQYSQMHNYHSIQDIQALNSLLKKSPQDQLSEFNALLTSPKPDDDRELETPIDLYFYLKDPAIQTLTQHYDQTAQIQPSIYASSFMLDGNKDHTPITEDIEDIENHNNDNALKAYTGQTITPESTTTKSNNYYKVEVASQTISGVTKPEEIYGSEDDQPTYQSLHYGHRPTFYVQDDKEDLNERYLHHNAQHKGVQHLSEDGTGVSAYDDNLHYAANYEFGYRVRDHHSGNDFGHREAKRDGKTNGHYHVLLPDGRMQNVKYSAGPEGFHADITYDHLV